MKSVAERRRVRERDVVTLYASSYAVVREAIDTAERLVLPCVAVIETKDGPVNRIYTRCDAQAKRRVYGLRGFSDKVKDPPRDLPFPLCGRHAGADAVRVTRSDLT
jgi:hypothetical protein